MVHLPGPSVLLRNLRSGPVNLNTAHLNILQFLDVFFSSIQHSLLYQESGLPLDSATLTLQQFSCLTPQLHVDLPCLTYRQGIHIVNIGLNQRSRSKLYMIRERSRLVCHCLSDTRRTIIQNRALTHANIPDNIQACHLLDGTNVIVDKPCTPDVLHPIHTPANTYYILCILMSQLFLVN